MFVAMRIRSISQFARIAALTAGLVTASVFAAPRAQQHQDPAQTAPIDEPRRAEQQSTLPIIKGKQAIHQLDNKCSTTLIVNANALFQPRRWTFNPDAAETMDVLGPMIAKAGKHPARIESYVAFAESDSYSQAVSEKRAITVRGWLVNHGFVSEGSPVQGFVNDNAPDKSDGSHPADGRKQDPRIEIVIDTCH